MRKLREHQAEAQQLARQIVDKGPSWPHKITSAYVTPGGGKTLLASVFAHELVRGDIVDHVLYVCPRDSLREQVVNGFTDASLDLPSRLVKISGKPSGQRSLMREDRMGFVTTYQSISAHPKAFAKLVSSDRWLTVLDECHHLPELGQAFDDEESRIQSGWTKHMAPIVEASAHVLAMSGTCSREKGKIAFIRHESTKAVFDIEHTRRAALAANSVLHVITKLCDGTAKYWYRLQANSAQLSADNGKESERVLETALGDPVYRDAVLSEAIGDWESYRDHNSRSRMIVICDRVSTCRAVMRYIRDHHSRWTPVLAVSRVSDGEESGTKAIRHFRDLREGQILVTCQMAYEGLDVPDCTHLVCLTHIRARSWLEQAFARVTRFDPGCNLPWEEQCAYLYAPADPKMVTFLSEWLDEQDASFVEPKPRVGIIRERPRRSPFDPDGCKPGDISYGDSNGKLPEREQGLIRRFRAEFPAEAKALRTEQWLKLARAMWSPSTPLGPDA